MNKASAGDGIPAELLKILKNDAVKVLHSVCQQIWKIQQWPQDWKRSVFILIPKKGSAKKYSNYGTNAPYFTCQQGRAQNPSSQVSAICEPSTFSSTSWVQKRQKNQRSNYQQSLDHRESKSIAEKKTSISASLTNCGKFLKKWEYQTTSPISLRNLYAGNNKQLELDVKQQTGSKLGKEYVKAIYCHPYLTYMHSESEVTQLCPTLCNPVDCGLPGSFIHGIFQPRVVEWVAISFSKGSSQPRDRTQVSHTAGRRFNL